MRTIAFLFGILILTTTFFGQSGTSTITGVVKDGSGSAVPGARITVTNENTGVAQSGVSNEAGAFRTGSLVPGTYNVEVEADGFQKILRRPIILEVGQVVALGLALELGKATETNDRDGSRTYLPILKHRPWAKS